MVSILIYSLLPQLKTYSLNSHLNIIVTPESVIASTRTTNPKATAYIPYKYTVRIPAPATLLSQIPCMKIRELEVAACMQVCVLPQQGNMKITGTR